jgi:hypothetical protein
MKMQTNIKEIKYLPLKTEETNRQNSNIDNSRNYHGDGITSEVHNTVDQRVRQPIFEYLLMADIECSSIGFTEKKVTVAIPMYKSCSYVKKSLASLMVEVKT